MGSSKDVDKDGVGELTQVERNLLRKILGSPFSKERASRVGTGLAMPWLWWAVWRDWWTVGAGRQGVGGGQRQVGGIAGITWT